MGFVNVIRPSGWQCVSLIQSEVILIRGCLTGAVFIDLRKAFDVNYEVLLKKLRGLGGNKS